MSVVILGGNECMERQYQQICKKHVYNAFAASEYSGGMVQNVTWVQFPKWQSIVAVEVGMANLQTKYQILFTPTGEIIRARNVTYTYNPLGAATFL